MLLVYGSAVTLQKSDFRVRAFGRVFTCAVQNVRLSHPAQESGRSFFRHNSSKFAFSWSQKAKKFPASQGRRLKAGAASQTISHFSQVPDLILQPPPGHPDQRASATFSRLPPSRILLPARGRRLKPLNLLDVRPETRDGTPIAHAVRPAAATSASTRASLAPAPVHRANRA